MAAATCRVISADSGCRSLAAASRDPGFPALLAHCREQPLLKGLRLVVQAEAAGFLDDSAFNSGILALQGTGLVYDILIFERQLAEATRFVNRHATQVFVLDHIAKPRIAAGELHPWAEGIRELAKRENVFCKISGMVTEADPKRWSPAQLRSYFDTVLEAFTPARVTELLTVPETKVYPSSFSL